MGARQFGQLIEAERLRRGWTRSKLAVAVGILDDGSALDATQVRRIVEGTRKLDQDTVGRIVEALDLPEDETPEQPSRDRAWHASGIWPPDLDLEGYRRFRQLASTTSDGVTTRKLAVLPVAPGLDELVRRNRRLELVAA